MTQLEPRSRLQLLSRERGVSLAQLSAMIGRNPTYLQQFVRKGSPRRLEERDRRLLAQFFGVDEAELGAEEEISYDGASRIGWVAVPRLSLAASAGGGASAADEVPFAAIQFTRDWLREHNLEAAMLSAIAVSGDSMNPTLRDGDEILVDRTPRPLASGIHVVRVGEALFVKRLDTGRPGTIGLISDNDIYPRIELPADEVAVIGRVVWKGGRL